MSAEKSKKPRKYSVEVTDTGRKNPRIYLSGAITGVPNYKKDFEMVKLELETMGYRNIVNPAELDEVILNGQYEDYMQICLALIDMCDIVMLIPGWRKSAGANREMGYALGKNKTVVTYEDLVIEKNSEERE